MGPTPKYWRATRNIGDITCVIVLAFQNLTGVFVIVGGLCVAWCARDTCLHCYAEGSLACHVFFGFGWGWGLIPDYVFGDANGIKRAWGMEGLTWIGSQAQ